MSKIASSDIVAIQKIQYRNENEQHIEHNEEPNRNRKYVARKRWAILARALKSPISSQPSSPTDDISVRRFSTFMLLKTERILESITMNTSPSTSSSSSSSRHWFQYMTHIDKHFYSVEIGHVCRAFTAADLMGFNNTGNVCVWPSEEALAYYCLNNLNEFQGAMVLELGAGMSALAGLMIAKYSKVKYVHLTDGNGAAVANIQASIDRNRTTNASASILQWGTTVMKSISEPMYDVILCADCLFFDDSRTDLIDTLHANLIREHGIALIMAPKRNGTLDMFVQEAVTKGFHVQRFDIYNEDVWQRHLECLDNTDYDPDLHYPILLRMKLLNNKQ